MKQKPLTQKQSDRLHKSFAITYVCRADLEGAGFDTKKVDNATMEHLASKMADAYCDDGFWIDLPIIAEHLNIPRAK